MHLAFQVPAAPGHVNPTLPLVSELVRRGHRVSYATGGRMVPTARAAGAHPVPLPVRMPQVITSGQDFTAEGLAIMLEEFDQQNRASLPVLEEYFRRDGPDVVCFDAINPAGRMVADALSVPAVALVPNFASNPESPFSESFFPNSFDFGHPRLTAVLRSMDDLAVECGLDRMPDTMSEIPADLNLVFVPRVFQPHADTFDERFHFIGPSVDQRAETDHWQPKEPEKPLLFVSLGTAFTDRPEFFRVCVEAFGDGPWQVAMAVGEQVDISEFAEVPTNVEIRPHFPQVAVLRHSDAFVTHAGMNSTMEALHFGVPTVAVPQFPEQRANARRTQELGLGNLLEATEITTVTLRNAVDTTAGDERGGANLVEMRRLIRDCGGAEAGADALETHLGR